MVRYKTAETAEKKLSVPAMITLTLAVLVMLTSVCLGLLAGQDKPEPQRRFGDISDSYAKDALIALFDAGILPGETLDGCIYLYPQAVVTRGEFACMTVKFLGISADFYTDDFVAYPDYATLDAETKNALCALSYYSLTDGVFSPAASYSPEAGCTRREAMLCLGKLVGGTRLDYGFSDMAETDIATVAQICGLLEKNIVIGFPDNTLRINAPLTREQLALIMTRFRSYTDNSRN